MTLPPSGQISIEQIRLEMGEVGGNYSLTALSTAPKLNLAAAPRPDAVAPHATSEFYNYSDSLPVSPSVTPSVTRSLTPTPTPSVTRGLAPSLTPSVTPSITVTPSVTPSITITPSVTVTPSVSACFAFYSMELGSVLGDDCSNAGVPFTAYGSNVPLEIGSRVFTTAGCSGNINGEYTDYSTSYLITNSVVISAQPCAT